MAFSGWFPKAPDAGADVKRSVVPLLREDRESPEVYTAQPVWESPTPSASKPFQAIAVNRLVV